MLGYFAKDTKTTTLRNAGTVLGKYWFVAKRKYSWMLSHNHLG